MKINYSTKKPKYLDKILGKYISIRVNTDEKQAFVNFLNAYGYNWGDGNPIVMDEEIKKYSVFCLTSSKRLMFSGRGDPPEEYKKDGFFTYKELFNEDKI